jgi:hypothetical protein
VTDYENLIRIFRERRLGYLEERLDNLVEVEVDALLGQVKKRTVAAERSARADARAFYVEEILAELAQPKGLVTADEVLNLRRRASVWAIVYKMHEAGLLFEDVYDPETRSWVKEGSR